MNNTPNMDILKVDTVIPDSKAFLKEMEIYLKSIMEANGKGLFAKDAISEMKSHLLTFLVTLAESHAGAAEEELKYIENLFDLEHVEKLFSSDRISRLKRKQNIFGYIPTYLAELKNMRNGRNAITLFIDCITKLGINFAAADSNYNEEEAKLITTHYQLLTKELLGAYYLSNASLEKINDAGTKVEKIVENQKSKETPEAEKKKKRTVDEILAELNELIGLSSVKYELNTLINLARINEIRKSNNLPIVETSMHLVFAGNPGTGKTTVARLLSEIYGTIGLLSKGELIEVTRSDLVGEFVGQTAQKTQNIIKKSIGNILFIDEAYSLSQGGHEDFGKEAISELVKEMEDNREDLVVIAAGYVDEMHKFIDINPGLQSRFNKYIVFDDYSPFELLEIFNLMLSKNKYKIPETLTSELLTYFNTVDKKTFSNARGVRNLFEKMVEQQANRLINIPNPSVDELNLLSEDDFRNAVNLMKTF